MNRTCSAKGDPKLRQPRCACCKQAGVATMITAYVSIMIWWPPTKLCNGTATLSIADDVVFLASDAIDIVSSTEQISTTISLVSHQVFNCGGPIHLLRRPNTPSRACFERGSLSAFESMLTIFTFIRQQKRSCCEGIDAVLYTARIIRAISISRNTAGAETRNRCQVRVSNHF
jgi:hypothetical protein